VTFRVFSVWKGAPTTDFTLHVTAVSEDDAYEEFRQGEQYVVFEDVKPSIKDNPVLKPESVGTVGKVPSR
jgi:hypothetical protein